jgi:hypothetical protein
MFSIVFFREAQIKYIVGMVTMPGTHGTTSGRWRLRAQRLKFGLSRHWDGLGSTSAMRQIADGDSVKQADGGFLHR